jgi:hypothetical protein
VSFFNSFLGGIVLAKQKKSEDLKEFTVGSVPPPKGPKGAKKSAPVAKEKLDIKEKDFPVLTGLLKSKDRKEFQQELSRVLTSLEQISQGGSNEEKSQADIAMRAYGLAIALLENSKAVR